MAFPIIVAGSLIIEALALSGFIDYIVNASEFLISGWLGLPPVAGIPLIFGVLRKELALILLENALAQQGMVLTDLNAIQMIVFSLVVMIYIPCIATIAACMREFGWRKALAIVIVDVSLALLLGGIAYRLLSLFMNV
jgi:ferrous iron transport protein B